MNQDFYSRIDSLTPRLEKMAAVFAASTVETAEDLYQDMVAHLLERQAANPTFFEQNDSYILDAGRKRVCLPALRRAGIESRYTTGEPEVLSDGETDEYYFDTLAGDEPNPETALINLEQAIALADVIRNLSKREREVLSLVVDGAGTNDIAHKFSISAAAVSVYKRRVADKLHWAVA